MAAAAAEAFLQVGDRSNNLFAPPSAQIVYRAARTAFVKHLIEVYRVIHATSTCVASLCESRHNTLEFSYSTMMCLFDMSFSSLL